MKAYMHKIELKYRKKVCILMQCGRGFGFAKLESLSPQVTKYADRLANYPRPNVYTFVLSPPPPSLIFNSNKQYSSGFSA